MENPYNKKKNRNKKNSFLKAIFFSSELSFPRTIPPGLKMSQKGSWKATHS